MTRSCGEAWWARRVRLQGFPLGFSEHLPPKTRVCLPYCTVLSTHHHLSLENVNLEVQLVSCIWKECFSSNPFDGSLTCLTAGDFYKLVNCLRPQLWEARSLKHLKDTEPFLKSKKLYWWQVSLLSQWVLPILHILYLLGTWRILINVIGI